MNDSYLTYDAVELAADPRFLDWVREGRDHALWEDWLARHPEKRETVAEARRLVEALQFRSPAGAADTGALWDRIRSTIREEEQAPVQARSRRSLVFYLGAVAAAASVALLIFLGIQWLEGPAVEAPRGAHLAHTLPDDSRVTLNADSRIEYRAEEWRDERRLSLEGEAFFEVEEGPSFEVRTSLGKVTVLGTAFNVYSREDRFSVRCTSGRVKVTAGRDTAGLVLTPGEECRLTAGGVLAKTEFDLGQGVGWLRDVYRFDEQPLAIVFAELERQFDVTIRADRAVRQRLYSGAFSGRDLDAALRDVCWPMNLVAEQEGKTIQIRPEPTE